MSAEHRPATAPAQGTARAVRAVSATLVAATAMLTRIPVHRSTGEATGAGAYGVIGAAIGTAGLAPLLLLGAALPTLAAILAVATMAIISGAVHIDGLADTADALLAPDPSRAEAARNDPAIGSGAVTAVVLVIGAQVAALASLANDAGPWVAGLTCAAAASASRALPVVLARLHGGSGASRVSPGLGAWFIDRVGRAEAFVTVAAVAAFAGVAGWLAGSAVVPIAVAAGSACGLTIALVVVRWHGQLDGDGFGATVEIGFLAIVAWAAVGWVAWPAR